MRLLRIPFPLGLAFAAIFLAVLAQYTYATQQKSDVAVIFFTVAIVLWWGSLLLNPSQVSAPDAVVAPATARSASRWVAVCGIGLVGLAYLFSGDNQFTSDGVLAWIASVAVLLYTFWEPAKTWDAWRAWFVALIERARATFAHGIRIPYRVCLLVLILLVGACFYFYKLDAVPAEMVSDHAEKVLDIRDIINGARPVYLLRNNGVEPLWSYVVAALVDQGGRPLNFDTLKFVSTLFGWLFIPALYFLARELFDDDIAVIAAAFATFAKWSLGIARAGLPFAMTPLFITLLLIFLVRAIKYQRRNDFLIAGIFLGAGFYASESFRIAPILVVAFLATAFLLMPSARQNWRAFFLNGILLFGVSFAVLAPLARFADDNLDVFLLHTTMRMVGDKPFVLGNALLLLAQNLGNALLMFNVRGDTSWLTTVPDAPMLDEVMGGLFVLGMALALYRWVRSRERIHVFLFLGLIILLIPSAISLVNPDDNPSALYAAGALPIVLIFVALALAWGAHVLAGSLRSDWRWLGTSAFVVVLFAVSAHSNYSSYYSAFDAIYRKASWNASEMAAIAHGFSQSIGDAEHIWIVGYPYWVDARNIDIVLGEENWIHPLPNADVATEFATDPMPKLFIVNVNDQPSLVRLREIFPTGRERPYHSRTPGHDFILFYTMGIPNQ